METLLGRPHAVDFTPAQLDHHSRHPVKGFAFPAMISNPEKRVDGFLIKDLNERELSLFDWFEGDEYNRKVVEVRETATGTASSSGRRVEAFAYLWKAHPTRRPVAGEEELVLLTDEDWSFEKFREEDEDRYLESTVRPCRDEMVAMGLAE